MRAARLTGVGLESLHVVDVAVPEPGDGEVLVRVDVVGMNRLDLNVIAGTGPGAAARLPRTVGIDPAGTITAAGAGVDSARLGRRVVVKPTISCGVCGACRSGHEADCPAQTVMGVHRDGGAAEYVAVPSRNAFDIGGLDAHAAVAAVHSVPIALHAIHAVGGIRSGDRVLVTGATGAVGRAAVQLAAHAGARVFAAARGGASDRVGLPAGGDVAVLPWGRIEELGPLLHAHDVADVDLVVDATGSADVVGAALALLAWRGRAVVCSASVSSDLRVDMRRLYLRRHTLVGAASADYAEVGEALRLVAAGVVAPAVGPAIPLGDIRAGYDRMRRADRSVGKRLVDVAAGRPASARETISGTGAQHDRR